MSGNMTFSDEEIGMMSDDELRFRISRCREAIHREEESGRDAYGLQVDLCYLTDGIRGREIRIAGQAKHQQYLQVLYANEEFSSWQA